MNDKILLFIPGYNCEKQIKRVLEKINSEIREYFFEIVFINNRSTDNTEKVVNDFIIENPNFKIKIFRNDSNYNLGGSHKVAFQYAIKNNFDYIVVLHGDDQGDINDIITILRSGEYKNYDCMLGARFMKDSILDGYSKFRIFGNKVYNMLFSIVLHKKIYDLGSGLNIYSVKMLKNNFYEKFPDKLTFNYCMVLANHYYKYNVKFFPISWREEDQVSNVKMISQAFEVLKMLFSYKINKEYIKKELRDSIIKNYSYKEINLNNEIYNTRFFNSIYEIDGIIVKKSKDIEKIKREYNYFMLLPNNMKEWMVEPYDYLERNGCAQYKEEKMEYKDISYYWEKEEIDIKKFKKILDKIFEFINLREKKEVDKNTYINYLDNVYIEKLDRRIIELKNNKVYFEIQKFINEYTKYNDIDEIVCNYKKIYSKLIKKIEDINKYEIVISHGDLYFGNMFFDERNNVMKFIDPKGALTEDELWMNPYYDISKLSHSIIGLYDFIVKTNYEIKYLNNNSKLIINFDNNQYINIFKEYLLENNYDYELVRLFEASLFLSMLPLHIDDINRMKAFILNAISVLELME